MNLSDITTRRLTSQRIAQADFTSPSEVVKHMGAMQAQDYSGALWAIGLRTKSATRQTIEQAIIDRQIVRTWPMRGTLHFVHADDIKWMVNLLGPRMTTATAGRRRALELDDSTLTLAKKVLVKALEGGNCLTRKQLCQLLDDAGIVTASQRGIHILRYYSEKALLCYGPHQGKEPTLVLLDEWLPTAKIMGRDESLTELARRYFVSHGPATLQDFAGWAFMTIPDAKLAIKLADYYLEIMESEGKTYYLGRDTSPPVRKPMAFLLPGFDEYMLGYKDRGAILLSEHAQKVVPGNNGMFLPTIVLDGRVAGTWKSKVKKSEVEVVISPFTRLSAKNEHLLTLPIQSYKAYVKL